MPIRVLIADDDPALAEAEAEFFQALGCSVLLAEDGLAALNLTRQYRPSIIFLDLNMPVVTGEEFVKLKNDDPQLAEIPVIVVSGHQPNAPLLGVSAFLPKPARPRDLREALGRHAKPPD